MEFLKKTFQVDVNKGIENVCAEDKFVFYKFDRLARSRKHFEIGNTSMI